MRVTTVARCGRGCFRVDRLWVSDYTAILMPEREGAQDKAARPQRILAVDDDPVTLRLLRAALESAGFEVAEAVSAEAAIAWIGRHGLPHLAVVDIVMPGLDGIELCRELHKFCDLPVIMLTSVDEKATVVRVIDELAEDYVTKPFDPEELAARVRRVMRRVGDVAYAQGAITVIDERLAIDFPHQQALVETQSVPLTPTETKLLHILLRNRRRTVRTDFLMRRLWPLEEVFEETLRVHVHRLRHKIEPDPKLPRYLITCRGQGYSFLSP